MLGEGCHIWDFPKLHHSPVPILIIIIDYTICLTQPISQLSSPTLDWICFFLLHSALCKSRSFPCSISWGKSLLVSWNSDKSGRCPPQDSLGGDLATSGIPVGVPLWRSHRQWAGQQAVLSSASLRGDCCHTWVPHLSHLPFYITSGCLHSCVQNHLLLPTPTHLRWPSHSSWGGGRAINLFIHLLLIFMMVCTMFFSPQALSFLILKNLTWKVKQKKTKLNVNHFFLFKCFFNDWLIWERERERVTERERNQFVVPLIYVLMGWFLYVSWLGIEPITLVYQDNTLTKWATQPEQPFFSFHWNVLTN